MKKKTINTMAGIWDDVTVSNAKKSEKKCDEYFAIMTGRTNWFSTVTKNPEFARIDFQGVDNKNNTLDIELKNRYINRHTYDSIMIEPEKLFELSGCTKDKALFINFLSNPDEFWAVNIKNLTPNDYYFVENVRVNANGLDENYRYNHSRFFIYASSGKYFKFDQNKNKYIEQK